MDQKTKRKPFPAHIIVFLAPALLVYSVFMVFPLLDSLRLSLFSITDSGQENFVAFSNFTTLLTNPDYSIRFWGALRNNFVFFIITLNFYKQNYKFQLILTAFS